MCDCIQKVNSLLEAKGLCLDIPLAFKRKKESSR